MVYIISADELQVLIELLDEHRGRLNQSQQERLSCDPSDLVRDLKGVKTGPAVVKLMNDGWLTDDCT